MVNIVQTPLSARAYGIAIAGSPGVLNTLKLRRSRRSWRACRRGSTGAIVDTMDEAVRMLPQVIALDRRAVRRRFEQRFSSILMANEYVAVYRSLLKRPSISERETILPLPRPVLPKKLNGQGLHGDRARRAAETGDLL